MSVETQIVHHLRHIRTKKSKRYSYAFSCVDLTGNRQKMDSLILCLDNATKVTYQTVRKHCWGLTDLERALSYDTGNERGGLRMRNDWAVGYYRSKFNDIRCYIVQHSHIEYFWFEEL